MTTPSVTIAPQTDQAHDGPWHRLLRQPLTQFGLCCLIALALSLPHLTSLPARDEADAIVAARAITQHGVPVFYQGDPDLQHDEVTVLGHFAVPGLTGSSTVIEVQDQFGAQTAVEHGSILYKVGNWHPPLYMYLLATALLLPLPMVIALRLLNLALLLISLAFLYCIARLIVLDSHRNSQDPAPARASDYGIPMLTCLAYVLISFGLRAHLLIEYTTTVAPATVLCFWYVHLRAPEQGWRGAFARAGAFALVAWANLGPILPLIGALVAIPLLGGRLRRALSMLATLGLGLLFFLVSFGIFSLWEGIPASATLFHSGSIVSDALATLPHPTAWAHIGGPLAMQILVVLFYGPPVLLALAIIGLRQTPWRLRPTRRSAYGLAAGSLALGLVLAIIYLLWQEVSVVTGLIFAVLWSFALADLFSLNWAALPYIWWLLPCLACAAVLASATIAGRRSEAIRSMALFAGSVTIVTLLAGSRAWGFPKYIAPTYGILVLLAVLCLVGLWTGQVRINGRATALTAGIGLAALCVMIWLPDFTCAAPDPQTGLCAGAGSGTPLSLWVSAFAALDILLVALLVGLAQRGGPAVSVSAAGSNTDLSRLAAPIFIALLLPLALFALPEQLALAHTSSSASFAYDAGDLNGIQQAGAYLAEHVSAGEEVVARKEVMVYAPGVRFVDDVLLPGDYLDTHPGVAWVVRSVLADAQFIEVMRFGAWGIYYRAPSASRWEQIATRSLYILATPRTRYRVEAFPASPGLVLR